MTEDEQQVTLGSLQQGAAALREALDGVSDDQAQRIPGPGRWSMLQCVEHIALTEDALFSAILSAEAAPAPLIHTGREERIAARGADRSRPVESPEGVRPRGSFSSSHQALRHFLASRENTLRYAATHLREDLRCRVTTHPLLGVVNVFEVLLLMAVHVQRHVGQINQIRAELASSALETF
jgi:hypothetical protein